ncbi:MAG: pyridoxal phosphate-dependent aminotransferase [Spirochaetota bacterium]
MHEDEHRDEHGHDEEHEHIHHHVTEKTSLEIAREKAEEDPEFIDLIDTNFHRNGLLFPANILSRALADYPSSRPYAPDPRGSPTAREAVARHYRERGLPVSPEQLIVTASASEGYNLVFNRMLERNQSVALPRPVYPLFEFIAEFNELEVEHYDLDLDHRAQPDPRSLAALSERVGLLVAISPNNPTGTRLDNESIDRLLGTARERGIPLLFDEVFSEFVYAPEPPHTLPAERAEDVLCITLNGVSKMFACPDLKLSWLLVTGPPDLREELLSVLEIANDMYLNASSVSQAVLPTLFEDGAAFRRDMVAELDRRRHLCLSVLERSRRLEPVLPTAGIHCVLRVRGGERLDDAELAEDLVREARVYTHPGYLYDIDAETALVVSFLKEPEALREGLKRLVTRIDRYGRIDERGGM